ncbi:FAD-dependent oxidoreductase [Microbacterium sp. NPDC077663]|uniref:FAD-dependent oxidoreductase n=1 Tax=Microbacterium sp. NPDC077663 TaxID=3364189 RepID=UPI0037C6FFC2
MKREYDLIVVGSGIAGQTTALAAAEAGLDTVIFEKQNAPGGTTVMSGGWFAFTGTEEMAAARVEDSREAFLSEMIEVGGGLNDRELLETYLDHQHGTYEWLKGHGAVFQELDWGAGLSVRRSHYTPIVELLDRLRADYLAAGGELHTKSHVTALLTDGPDHVTGVTVATSNGPVEVISRGGVVLATGGFTRGTDFLRIFAPKQLQALPFGGRGNTGDGLRMAWALGAGLADMSFVSGTFGSHPETGDVQELLTAFYMGAIVVNQQGRRFIDESVSYKLIGNAVLDQPDGLGFEIFDAKIRAQSHRGVPVKDIDTLEEKGHVLRATTLEELAEIAGIDQAGLVATVARYNEAIASGRPDDVGRNSISSGAGELVPIDEPPYYAYPAKSLLTSTYCGITVTPEGVVRTIDGRTLDGLYAVGEIVGGFHGAAYISGTSLGKGAVFGRIVGNRVSSLLHAR